MNEKKSLIEKVNEFLWELKVYIWYWATQPFRMIYSTLNFAKNTAEKMRMWQTWSKIFGLLFLLGLITQNKGMTSATGIAMVISIFAYTWEKKDHINTWRKKEKVRLDRKLKNENKEE